MLSSLLDEFDILERVDVSRRARDASAAKSANRSAKTRARRAQLPLPFEPPRDRLRRRLDPMLSSRIELVETSNRVNLVSFRIDEEGTVLRVSDRLADAPEEILESIARWARGGRGSGVAGRTVRAYVQQMPYPEEGEAPRALESKGMFHDLATLMDKVRDEHLPRVRVRGVGWARAPRRRRRRSGSVRLASFQEASRTIRVHPALDSPHVPAWVVEFLLFHELLHAKLGSTVDAAGRTRFHTPTFRQMERDHPDCGRYLEWERGPLARVLRQWDRG